MDCSRRFALRVPWCGRKYIKLFLLYVRWLFNSYGIQNGTSSALHPELPSTILYLRAKTPLNTHGGIKYTWWQMPDSIWRAYRRFYHPLDARLHRAAISSCYNFDGRFFLTTTISFWGRTTSFNTMLPMAGLRWAATIILWTGKHILFWQAVM